MIFCGWWCCSDEGLPCIRFWEGWALRCAMSKIFTLSSSFWDSIFIFINFRAQFGNFLKFLCCVRASDWSDEAFFRSCQKPIPIHSSQLYSIFLSDAFSFYKGEILPRNQLRSLQIFYLVLFGVRLSEDIGEVFWADRVEEWVGVDWPGWKDWKSVAFVGIATWIVRHRYWCQLAYFLRYRAIAHDVS